jgi:alpha-amylase
MKYITLSFQIHQPFRLKKYRFFDIGNDSYYYDDFENERNTRNLAENYYLPTNEILINLLKKYSGRFKIAFAISGVALDQFYLYSPEVLESFQRMVDTGGVEFLGETYSHSLASVQTRRVYPAGRGS